MAKKATNYEIIQRVGIVIDLLLDGYSRHEILQYTAEEWGMKARQTQTYMAHANKRISRMARKAERHSFDKTRARLEKLYKAAVEDDDKHLARLLIQDMRKLYGFDKPDKVEIGGSLGLHPVQKQLDKLSDEQVFAIADGFIDEEKKK